MTGIFQAVLYIEFIMFSIVVLCAAVAYASAGFLGPHTYLGAPLPAAVSYAAPVVYAAPYIGSSQYRAQDTLGQYSYGYATGNGIAKSEARGIDGSVAGGYGYTAPDGKRIEIKYTAGPGGFKAEGNAIPKPVEPTPEVKAAAEKHEQDKAAAAAKAAEAPKPVVLTAPLAYAAHPYNYLGYGFHHLKALYHAAPYAHHGYSYVA